MEDYLIIEINNNRNVTIHNNRELGHPIEEVPQYNRLYYTLDGTEPDINSNYHSVDSITLSDFNFDLGVLDAGVTIKAILAYIKNLSTGTIIQHKSRTFTKTVYAIDNDYYCNISINGNKIAIDSNNIYLGDLYIAYNGKDINDNPTLLKVNRTSYVSRDTVNLELYFEVIWKYGDYVSNKIIHNAQVIEKLPTPIVTNNNGIVHIDKNTTYDARIVYIITNQNGGTTEKAIWGENTAEIILPEDVAIFECYTICNFLTNGIYIQSDVVRFSFLKIPNCINIKLVPDREELIPVWSNDYIGYNKVYTINDSNINESSNKLNNYIDSSPVKENDIIRIVSYAVDNDNIIFGDIYTYKFILKCLTAPTVDMISNKVVLTTSYRNAEIYYTIDETTPNKSSIKYTNPIELHTDVTLKAIVYVGRFYSEVIEYDTTRIPSYNSNIVTLTGGENIPLKSNILKCFVDVAFTNDYETIKSLENISYTLNEIVNKTNINNPMEEFLNRRFSGDSLEIYTDETSTGELDINTDNNTNKFNNYAYPYFEKGKWNLNYFRNKIKDKPTTEEKENRTYSDNHSIIYGKYFGIRFIFNNDKKIKFDTLDININAY